MKWFSYLYRWLDRLILWGGIAAGILIVVTTGMIFYEIVSRSLFDAPTTWATELSVYAIIGSMKKARYNQFGGIQNERF